MNLRYSIILPFILVALISCNNGDNARSHGSIRLGDSASIVTENDSEYLKDIVTDFKSQVPERAQEADTAATPPQQQQKDTAASSTAATPAPAQQEAAKPAPETPAAQPQGEGLTIAFKDVSIFIPGLSVKTYRKQNLERANGASYQLTGGKLNGNHIKIVSGDVTRISQHYQTVVTIKNELGTLPLDALSSTTEWQALQGSKGTYTISGLDGRHLQYSKATPAQIRKALERAMRTHRISKRKQKEWLNSIGRVRAVNQPPLSVTLRSVIWKIEGKDARGRSFQKQVRVDLPI